MPDFYLEPIFKAQSAHTLQDNNNGDGNAAPAADGNGDECEKPKMKKKRKSKILRNLFRKKSSQKVTPANNWKLL